MSSTHIRRPLSQAFCSRRRCLFHTSIPRLADDAQGSSSSSGPPSKAEQSRQIFRKLENLPRQSRSARSPPSAPPSNAKEVTRRVPPNTKETTRRPPTGPRTPRIRTPTTPPSPKGPPSSPPRRRAPSPSDESARNRALLEDADLADSPSPSQSLTQAQIDAIPVSSLLRLPESADLFSTDVEQETYADLADFIDAYRSAHSSASALVSRAPSDSLRHRATTLRTNLDASIGRALRAMLAADESAAPHYDPAPAPPLAIEQRGRIGGSPTGAAGMGRVAEDGVRLLAGRSGLEWQDPRELADRLIAGELVQFVHESEKQDVIALAEQSAWDPERSGRGEKVVGFAPLEAAARERVVRKVVRGRYEDPRDKEEQGVMREVARLVGNNATYLASEKEVLYRTMKQLLPKERPPAPATEKKKDGA